MASSLYITTRLFSSSPLLDDEVKTRLVSEPVLGPDQVSEPSEVSETEEVCWLRPLEADDGSEASIDQSEARRGQG